VDFRLIAATALDLNGMVADGRFRDDLYYPLLAQRFLSWSDKPVTIRQDALERIMAHDWPGNVRQLENVITRAIVLAPGGVITPDCIQFAQRPAESTSPCWEEQIPHHEGYWNVIRRVEARLLRAALQEARGNKAEAARILGIPRRLLYEKITEFGMA